MPIEPVSSPEDPRLAPYQNLKERDIAKQGGRFIAEGEQLVKRLLASDFPTESVLLSRRRADEIAPLVPPAVPVYVAPDDLIESLLGFRFHSGVIACGLRKPFLSIDDLFPSPIQNPQSQIQNPVTLVVCPEIANNENLGTIIRVAAGFGADALILGPRSCDPFFRQSVRVSMGTVFRLPIVWSRDLPRDLRRLREEFGVELIATVLDDSAEPLAEPRRSPRIALLFGNEAQGLDRECADLCHRRVTIPMKRGTDSLNVSVAAGIFLYHFTR